MQFNRIETYHHEFFLNHSIEDERLKNNNFFKTIVNRGEYLKKNQIIFNDPLDMEAVSTPYQLELNNLMVSPNNDLEWCYMVSRNGYLLDLAILYAYTKDDIYLKLWKKYLFDFIKWQDASPHVWRILDVGLRLNNWMKSFIYIPDLQDKLNNYEQMILQEAIKKQILHIRNNFSEKNYLSNWGILALTGVIATEQFLPNIVDKQTADWAWDALNESVMLQFYNDGIHWEQSPMYHHEVTMCLLQLWLNSCYLNQVFPKKLYVELKKMITTSYYYCDQNFKLLSLHDSDAVDFTYVYSIYELSGFLDVNIENTPGIFYVGKQFKYDKKTLEPLFYTGESGFLAYKNEDIYLTLFNGRHGSGHGHSSLGSLTLTYQGKEIIKDPGRYTYLEDPLRIILKEESSHSSLMIDNTPLTQIASSWQYKKIGEPIFHQSKEDKEHVIFEISWHGKIGSRLVVFKRTIIYFKKMMVILVINTTDCPGLHVLSTRYQMNENLKLIEKDNCLELKGSPFTLYTGNQMDILINDKVWSPKYNELDNHQELLLEQSFEDCLVSYECFYPHDSVTIEPISCYQNKSSAPCPSQFYFGIKLTSKKGESQYEYYHSAYDTFIGDKLYSGEHKRLLYGKNKIFKIKLGEK
ncbi:heparinase II/III family protein [Vagococcus lutrae]|uniref:heparinase II/III domain-containing protein n=1 Tax=Vagococcus lutrae TaxID=81947 RepID=UPI00200E92AB|nr:heparinase II/III family protein [Vagococcus lutrae]UQF37952.1 heparinase II/III family protein [Vagococcus lutrae]